MCIGIPMQVESIQGSYALCSGMNETRQVDMTLLGEQVVGTWVLVFIDVAREVLDEVRAQQITQAIEALSRVQNGLPIDDLFSDLLDREPELPQHLKQTGR